MTFVPIPLFSCTSRMAHRSSVERSRWVAKMRPILTSDLRSIGNVMIRINRVQHGSTIINPQKLEGMNVEPHTGSTRAKRPPMWMTFLPGLGTSYVTRLDHAHALSCIHGRLHHVLYISLHHFDQTHIAKHVNKWAYTHPYICYMVMIYHDMS